MLGNLRYHQYTVSEHKLSPDAIEYITLCRTTAPSRTVGIHARTNVVAADVSGKMNATVAAESHAERSIALQFEYDPDVLEYWDQPPSIEIRKVNKRGSRRRQRYTPDFLCLKTSGPELLEVKTLEEAEKLVEKDPKNWSRLDSGYDYIPAREAYKNNYGLAFRVITASRRDQQIAENIRILLASRDAPKYDPLLGLKIDGILIKQPVWRMDELVRELNIEGYTSIVQMIDCGRLAFNRESSSLAYPERCYVAANSNLLTGYMDFDADGALRATDEIPSMPTSSHPTSKVAETVLKRLSRINSGEKSSSVRRWKKQISEGADKGLSPFQSLIDADRNISGRNSKLRIEVKEFLEYFSENVRLIMRTESPLQIYYEYSIQARNVHPQFPPVSTQTFYTRIKQIAPEVIGEAKGGKRMALAMSPPTDPKKRHIVPTLPWMKASLDHYCADIYLVVYDDLEIVYVARPWISLMIDIATSEVLAFAISIQNPSRRSCAKLFRECVRRHGKLPREIIVDHGSDFTSVYFRSLLAHYRVTHTLRPTSNSRFGSEVERFFGQFKEEWLSQRPGYIFGLKTLRAIDGKKSPSKSAVLTIEDLYQELTTYLQWRSSKPIGTSSKSSSVLYDEKLREFPFIPISVENNHEFVLATSVESRDYRIDPQRGIHIRGLHYSCPQLRELYGKQSSTEVRIDPENPYVIYVRILNKWVPAYNSKSNRFIEMNSSERISEGIKVYECSSSRRKINGSKGVELSEIRQRFDESIEKRLIINEEGQAVIQPEEGNNSEVPHDDFVVRDLSSERWKS